MKPNVALRLRFSRTKHLINYQFKNKNIYIFTIILLHLFMIFDLGTEMAGSDSSTYLGISDSISKFGILSSHRQDEYAWPVGYPLFLLFLNATGAGYNLILVRLIQFGMLISIAFMIESYMKYISKRNSKYIFILVLIDPSMISAVQIIGYEILIAFCLTSSIYYISKVIKSSDKSNEKLALLAGLFFGLSLAVQSKFIFVILILLGLLLKQLKIRSILFFLIPIFIILFCLWIRNVYAFNLNSPFPENWRVNFYIGNNPAANGTFHFNTEIASGFKNGMSISDLLSSTNMHTKPNDFLQLQVNKLTYLVGPEIPPGLIGFERIFGENFKNVSIYLMWIFSLYILFGFLLHLFTWILSIDKKFLNFRPFSIIVILGIVMNLPFFGMARYRIPVEPFLILVSVLGYKIFKDQRIQYRKSLT